MDELVRAGWYARGRFLLRACMVNFHSTWEDLYARVDIVARLGRELDAELRAPLSFPEC